MATVEAIPEIQARTTASGWPEIGPWPHRITVERFERMIEAGIYGEDDRIFLWMGRLYETMAPGQPHVFVTSALSQLLARIVPVGWYVLQEQPIVLDVDSLPQPDVAVVRGSMRDYLKARAKAREASLVIEVADSSVAFDSSDKMAAYAGAGIPAYWIANIPAGQFVVFGDPTGPAETPSYRSRAEFGPDDEVPVILDGREVGRISVKEILP
jgi:Uma2 family endonuclease